MPINFGIKDFFSVNSNTTKRRPVLNEVPTTFNRGKITDFSTNLQKKKRFWEWFMSRPELNAPVMIRVDDTITEVDFFETDGMTPLDKTKLKAAQDFWNSNQMYERLKSVQFDRLITGDGYLWLGSVLSQRSIDKETSLGEIKKICLREAKKYCGDIQTRETDFIGNKLFLRLIDEDLRKTRSIDYIASSTTQILHDQYDIKGYRQYNTTNPTDFTPEEIVHIPLHRYNGKVTGFTPIESLGYELILLYTIKENMLAYFRNGGKPSMLFMLPEEIANSENHAWLVQTLQENGALENRHGNLVLTGKIDVKELENSMKDMEYKELALYATSNIAYALRVPVSRIPYLIGSASSGSDAGGLADSGYWSMIESDQRTIEMHINQQIFNKLGFSVRFKRNYKIDDVREADAATKWIAAISSAETVFKNRGKRLKLPALVSLIAGNRRKINILDLEDVPKEDMMMNMSMPMENPQSKMKDVTDSPAKQKANETKRLANKNNPKGANQTGV